MRFLITFVLALGPTAATLAQALESAPPVTEPLSDSLVDQEPEGELLTATQAIGLALAASPNLERSRAMTERADAAVREARVGLYPRLEVSASYSRIGGFADGEIALGDPESQAAARALAEGVSDPVARDLWRGQLSGEGVTIEVPRNRMALRARLNWSVTDAFTRVRQSLRAAEANAEAGELESVVAEASTRRATYDAYLTVVRAEGGLEVARAALAGAEEQRDEFIAAARAGLLGPAEPLAAEARVAEVAQAIVDAEAAFEIASIALRAQLGLEPGALLRVTLDEDELPPLPVTDSATLGQTALEARPELRALRARRAALNHQRSALRAGAYPRLGVFANADYANPNPYQIPPQSTFTPSFEVGLQVSWSPNDLTRANRQVSQSAAELAALDADIAGVERMVQIEARSAATRLSAAARRIDSAEASLRASEEAYESARAALRAGAGTSSSVLEAENRLRRSQLAVLDAKVGKAEAHVGFAYAMGRL